MSRLDTSFDDDERVSAYQRMRRCSKRVLSKACGGGTDSRWWRAAMLAGIAVLVAFDAFVVVAVVATLPMQQTIREAVPRIQTFVDDDLPILSASLPKLNSTLSQLDAVLPALDTLLTDTIPHWDRTLRRVTNFLDDVDGLTPAGDGATLDVARVGRALDQLAELNTNVKQLVAEATVLKAALKQFGGARSRATNAIADRDLTTSVGDKDKAAIVSRGPVDAKLENVADAGD